MGPLTVHITVDAGPYLKELNHVLSLLQEFTKMNEQDFTRAFVDRVLESHSEAAKDGLHASASFAGSIRDTITQIVAFLRSKGVTWASLFAAASQIYQIVAAAISAGGTVDWKALAKAIWMIFFPNVPFPIAEIALP